MSHYESMNSQEFLNGAAIPQFIEKFKDADGNP
jgi:hypothetical protein